MAEQPRGKVKSQALVRLVRFSMAGAFTAHPLAGVEVNLKSATGRERRTHQQVLDHALKAGVLYRKEDRFEATDAGRAFLRRALADASEDAFQSQHQTLATEELPTEELAPATGRARQHVRRNLDESPLSSLSRLRDRGGERYFSEDMIEAGKRLSSDFHRGGLQPRVTSRWEPRLESRGVGGAGGMADIADAAMAARLRVARAVEAMGPELSGAALDICCFEKGLETVERERQWPARSAKLMLRTALAALARHYAPPVPADARRAHHWGAEGFRPEL